MLTSSNVQVVDDLFPEPLKTRLIEAMCWMPVHFINRWQRYRSHELDVHWYYPIAFSDDGGRADVEPDLQALDDNLRCVAESWQAIKASCTLPVRLYECMLSANAFGTEGRVHHDVADADERGRHRTALVYCNPEWELGWGGETLVFDTHDEIVAAVVPKPGRVIKIAGDPPHVGRSISRTCPTDRRVLVFKYWEDAHA